MTNVSSFGAIAQLVEHLHGMQGVSGSSPLGSIRFLAILEKLVKNKDKVAVKKQEKDLDSITYLLRRREI